MFKKISVRIIFLVVATMAVMAAGIAAVSWKRIAESSLETQKRTAASILRLVTQNIQNQYSQLVDFEMTFIVKRRELLKQENATILAHLQALDRLAREGRIRGDAARAQALEWIDGQREPDRDIIVFDTRTISLSQADRSMIGKPLTGFRNIRSADAFASMLDRLTVTPDNYSVIFWPTPPGSPPRKQLAYFTSFPDWGWIIARTEPIDDLEAIMASKRETILKDVQRTISEIRLPDAGYLFLFNGGGEMLIHPWRKRGVPDDPAGRELMEFMRGAAGHPDTPLSYSGPGAESDTHFQRKLAFVDYFKPLDWYIGYALLEKDLEAAATHLTSELLVLILAASCLGVAVLLYFLRRFTRPLIELMGLVNDLPGQEFVLDPPRRAGLEKLAASPRDEAGRLAASFRGLLDKLGSHLEELRRLGQERITHIAALEEAKSELEAKVAERTANLLRANDLLSLEVRQREETARSLRASEEKFRALAESMPGVVYLTDADARVPTIYLNDFIRQITGYPKEDFLEGRIPYFDLIHPDDRNMLEDETARAAREKTAYRLEYRLRRKDGKWRWIEDHGRGFAGPDGRDCLEGVLHDVTDRVEGHFDLMAAKEQAEQASRAKTDFLANMSHEIRTPLNTVLGMADLLSETALTPRQHRYVQNLTSSGQQLLSLISDILDFSRIESGRIEILSEPFDLTALLDDVAAIVRPAAEKKGLDIEILAAPELWPWRMGDATKIKQILVNLAANAVKFTHTGGVLVSVSEAPQAGGRLLFHVVDTGEGIARDKHQAVFEKFTQADGAVHPRHGGTGLGLAISRRLVQAMGGDIRLESEPGMGSMFLVSLELPPAPAGDRPAAPRDRAPQARRDGARLRVLVAEDVAANREVIRLYLQDSAVDARFAEDGAQALRLFRDTPFDVVLMDIEMPEVDGLEATRRMRRIEAETGRPPARILALTAHAFAEFRATCLSAGCDGFLAKPLTKRALLDALDLAPSRAMPAPPAEAAERGDRVPPRFEPLLPALFESLDQYLVRARPLSEEGDRAGLARIAHAVKGACATYGLAGLASLAAELESASGETAPGRAESALSRLAEAVARARAEYALS